MSANRAKKKKKKSNYKKRGEENNVQKVHSTFSIGLFS